MTVETIKSDLLSFQENPPTKRAFIALKAAWDASNGPDRAGILQRGYAVYDEGVPTSSMFVLDPVDRSKGIATPPYVAAHTKYADYLQGVVRDKGYTDAFLLTLDGDCIWSY